MIKKCGKTAYPSENTAKKQMRWIERKGKEMRIYQCRACHHWHLTGELERRKGLIDGE